MNEGTRVFRRLPPPLDAVESLTWIERIVSLSMGMEHACGGPWLSEARGACAGMARALMSRRRRRAARRRGKACEGWWNHMPRLLPARPHDSLSEGADLRHNHRTMSTSWVALAVAR